MSSFGKVIGGAYLDSTVATATFGSDLVVQTGFKGRKLTAEHVKSWEEIPIETKDTAISAMGKAAAGVALPGRFGKAASAAVGAAFDLVSGLVKDRFSSGAKTSTDAPVTHAPQVDVTEQLRKLASLRDAGILSEEEFALKKTELLGRL